ncbi:TatD family deoxyribonuclease [Aureimonas flava]|uniref:TatD family deoxyribonuclease n=1 Tax=Aureimonas flava TaxID=2320271 RepID=A0A3A1WRS5_9HYPH|nr:TatD family hydrolase [Aureimonas flava]RIY03773.1 TatD family deoxyribonuclease [Aureimonas flava]
MTTCLLVDSHCHLDFPDFDTDREALIARANAAGVGVMVSICTQVVKHERVLAIAERYPCVFASVGTHPLNAADEDEVPVEDLVRLARHPKVVAIGEAGLDYHYDRAPRDRQERVFRRHIAAARETGLPLVIHARDADTDVERILVDEVGKGAFPFVLHCFTAGERLATVGVELGGYVSFSGIVAFKNSTELRAIAACVPQDRILVETDAPYLAPPPNRGKRNEPAFVRDTATALSEALGHELEAFARQTTDNFFRLFSEVPDPRKGGAA